MDIENLSQAHIVFQQLKELQSQKYIVSGGSGVGVTIQSAYQDDDFIEAIRPHVIAELDRRIEDKKGLLANLGITF
ncbi:hypothetical protein [Lonsdalea quercina]|uniref:hypothetical protein n=1 Tax=Lonsdalea quercina TaxID=71657 RepID=UPI0039748F4C